MQSRTLTVAALSLALPTVAFAAAKDTPAGIEKQCETYGYVETGDIRDVLTLGVDFLGKIGDDPDDEVDSILVDILDDTRQTLVTGTLTDQHDTESFLVGNLEAPGGDDETLYIDDVSVRLGEIAVLTVAESGSDAILYIEVVDDDGTVDTHKVEWEDGGCNTKGVECTYTTDLGRYDGLASDDRILYVPVDTESTAKKGDPIRVVKVVKSLTGLG